MSYLAVAPDMLAAAATNVESIGSALTAANTAVASSTSAVTAAGADEVSTAIASLFSQHGAAYQQVSEDMAAFHNQFVQALNAGASSYVGAEAANASPLETFEQDVVGAINAPFLGLTGRPLIGDGANGTATSRNGAGGGWLYGNGGNGYSS